MRSEYDDQGGDKMEQDPHNYIWGIFYFNPRDRRIILPKKNPSMGLTLNFANPYTYLILMIWFSLIFFLTRLGVPHSQFPKIM